MKLLAIDAGFVATGLAIMERDIKGQWSCIEVRCIETQADNTKKSQRKSDSDIERVLEITRGIGYAIDDHSITRAVVELPHGGARSGRSMRCMALASAAIAVVLDERGLAVENFSPNDTRIAAVGRAKNVSKQDVIDAMLILHPILARCCNEHTADALATFEAARAGNLVRL